jgi:restriction endonuclease S subunit
MDESERKIRGQRSSKRLVSCTFSGFTIRGRVEDPTVLPLFLAHFFKSRDFAEMIKTVGQGANIRNLSQAILTELKIPLPPFVTQKAIVAEIEAEQALVAANRELITRFEKKIQTTLSRVWGEAPGEAMAAENDALTRNQTPSAFNRSNNRRIYAMQHLIWKITK